MTRGSALCLLVAALGSACVGSGSSTGREPAASESPEVGPARESGDAAPSAELHPVAPSALLITSGNIIATGGSEFEIHSPVLRAELGQTPRSSAELRSGRTMRWRRRA